MAKLSTRWLLSILLVSLSDSVSPADPPGPPSPPECFIPCGENNCLVDIHCTWAPRPEDPLTPAAEYTLHWKQEHREEGHVISVSGRSGLIHRVNFSNTEELRVWVQAKSQHGSVQSEETEFHINDITKPPPPVVTVSHQDPTEIEWKPSCERLKLSLGNCDVRHRAEAEGEWHEELGFHASYTFDSLEPCTVYEFQVRCACDTGLKSDWSAVDTTQSTENAPVGDLDIWRDCGLSHTNAAAACALTWKLPSSLACGLVLGYEVRLSYTNGKEALVNVSPAESPGRLACEKTRCRFTPSLKDVSSVNVSAYNSHGASAHSYLAMSKPGKEKNEVTLHLRLNEEDLTVTWDQLSGLPGSLKEYVLQYKQAGRPPGQGFDWLKVDKNQRSGFFKGPFKKYMPYQVSLFTMSQDNEVRHCSSAVGYSLQGTPATVPSFEVFSIAATCVTLHWQPVPLEKQNGNILYYQIGVHRENVYNVTAPTRSFELLNLSPGQEYVAWIRAVTAAGPGENTTTTFKTKHTEEFGYWPLLALVSVSGLVLLCVCGKRCGPLAPQFRFDKVPDPSNSHIFTQMKHQMTDSLTWTYPAACEPHHKISILEIVESHSVNSKSPQQKMSDPAGLNGPGLGDRSSVTDDCQDDQRDRSVPGEGLRTGGRPVREAYSKMIDSDKEEEEEDDEDEDCRSSSDEEECTGYERHFMPTVLELQRV